MRKIAVVAVVSALCCVQTGAQKLPKNVADAAIFVRKFYNWYVPMAKKSKDLPAERALAEKGSSFDPALAAGLEENFAAQAKSEDLVGIDFDPILDGQDFCDSYPQSTPTTTGSTILVPVYCQMGGKLSPKPVVMAEVSYRREQWVFVNFHYEDGGNLITLLAQQKKNRKKH